MPPIGTKRKKLRKNIWNLAGDLDTRNAPSHMWWTAFKTRISCLAYTFLTNSPIHNSCDSNRDVFFWTNSWEPFSTGRCCTLVPGTNMGGGIRTPPGTKSLYRLPSTSNSPYQYICGGSIIYFPVVCQIISHIDQPPQTKNTFKLCIESTWSYTNYLLILPLTFSKLELEHTHVCIIYDGERYHIYVHTWSNSTVVC